MSRATASVRGQGPGLAGASDAMTSQLLARARVTVAALEGRLNDSQRRAAALVSRGRNLFASGGAGAGKSWLMQYLIARMRLSRGEVRSIAVTATTGVAAIQIGGVTLHKWAGIGKGDGGREAMLSRIRQSRSAVENWRTTQLLFIDEISMLSGELLSALCWIGSVLRGNFQQPMGGIQLVTEIYFHSLPLPLS